MISFSISAWLSSYYNVNHPLFVYPQVFARFNLVSVSLAGWDGQQLFPFVWRKYFVREDREGGQSVGTAELQLRLSTLLLLKSILATERSRISRYLSHHQGFHSPASSMLTHHPTSYQPHYTPPLCLSHIIITRNMDGVLPCNDSRCTVHCTI